MCSTSFRRAPVITVMGVQTRVETSDEAAFSMPPDPQWWAGREAIVASWAEGGFGSSAWAAAATASEAATSSG